MTAILKYFENNRSFQGVSAGQTATVELSPRDIYNKLTLIYRQSGTLANQATIDAGINEIRLIINGKVQRRITATRLNAINAYNGKTLIDGHLNIYLTEFWRRTVQGEDSLGWGMADVATFHVEVDIASGATSPTLEIVAYKRRGDMNMGPIVKWRNFIVPVSATGLVNVLTFPKQDAYYKLHCQSANIADVSVKADGVDAWDGISRDIARDIAADEGFSFQTGFFHVDFTYRRVAEALRMKWDGGGVNDLQVDFNMSGTGNFNVLAEVLGLRD